MKNLANICISILSAIQNSYSNQSKFFVKKVILSREGTTQGDSLAIAMYGLATLPLKKLVNDNSLTQKLYAEDWNAVGSLKSLRTVFDNIFKQKNYFGYHVKASKCQLIVKD